MLYYWWVLALWISPQIARGRLQEGGCDYTRAFVCLAHHCMSSSQKGPSEVLSKYSLVNEWKMSGKRKGDD